MTRTVLTGCPAVVASRRMAAGSSRGGLPGRASCCTWVTAYSPIPLRAAASTGNVVDDMPPSPGCTAGPAFSPR